MVKRKASVTQDDESFVWKSTLISTSTKKTIEVHDLLKEIEDEDKKKIPKNSPKFNLAGVDFSIKVYPDNSANNHSGSIGVYLCSYSKEDQTVSLTVKEALGSARERSFEMKKLPAFGGWGWADFLSHEKYRELAMAQGDVFKLEAVVTLHSKAEGDGWTR